jgi:hypothetical protein
MKYVLPRAQQAEALKAAIEEYNAEKARVGNAAALAAGLPVAGVAAVVGANALVAALSASLTLTMVPVAGWIAGGVIALGVGVAALLMATTKTEDPMEQPHTAEVSYCVEEVVGGE